jgi:Cu/Zn superoxide dismutase
MGPYPGYVGTDVPPSGTVLVTAVAGGQLHVSVTLQGLNPNSTGGIHIHSGTTCSNASLVGGHYWTPANMSDPWNMVMWTSNAVGDASAEYTVDTGYPLSSNFGHALVVHTPNGTRIACGVLVSTSVPPTAAPTSVVTTAAPTPTVGPALVATIGAYPGSMQTPPSGTVVVTGAGGDTLSLWVNLQGLDPNSTGGIHIHSGTTCSNASLVGGHYWTPSNVSDPWNTVMWTSDAVGAVSAMFTVTTGYPLADNFGHAVVVHAPNGTRIACGVLMSTSMSPTAAPIPTVGPALVATIGAYPGSMQTPPSGTVVVTAVAGGTLSLWVNLQGLDPNSTGGVHIHSGMSCSNSSLVGGHYWTPSTMPDPWMNVMWTSDAVGAVSAMFTVTTGYPFSANWGHTVTVHAPNGTRIGCGVLMSTSMPPTAAPTAIGPALVATMGPYPGAMEDPPSGTVVVTTAAGGQLHVSVSLQGLDATTGGGVHIHSGMSCSNASLVGGHYWTPSTMPDPWMNVMWTSDAVGDATAEHTINTGYPLASNYGHALVVHTPNGTRIGCGILMSTSMPPTAAPTPMTYAPVTTAPTMSLAPVSYAPVSSAPVSVAPTASLAPAGGTYAPVSLAPVTSAPTMSLAPVSYAPVSTTPTSRAPTSASPTTMPTSVSTTPTSRAPTSASPTTMPTSSAPTNAPTRTPTAVNTNKSNSGKL